MTADKRLAAWTDYPFVEHGDTPGKLAPLRLVHILSWDGDKYCVIEHVADVVKRCYLYKQRGRVGRVPRISTRQLKKLPRTVYG